MTNEQEELTITKVEIGTLMGHDALFLHYVGDADQFPNEVADSARQLVREIWPNQEVEPHHTPVGQEICLETPQESASSVAMKLEDAIRFHVTVANGELELNY